MMIKIKLENLDKYFNEFFTLGSFKINFEFLAFIEITLTRIDLSVLN